MSHLKIVVAQLPVEIAQALEDLRYRRSKESEKRVTQRELVQEALEVLFRSNELLNGEAAP